MAPRGMVLMAAVLVVCGVRAGLRDQEGGEHGQQEQEGGAGQAAGMSHRPAYPCSPTYHQEGGQATPLARLPASHRSNSSSD